MGPARTRLTAREWLLAPAGIAVFLYFMYFQWDPNDSHW